MLKLFDLLKRHPVKERRCVTVAGLVLAPPMEGACWYLRKYTMFGTPLSGPRFPPYIGFRV